jgi:hypothetical protein
MARKMGESARVRGRGDVVRVLGRRGSDIRLMNCITLREASSRCRYGPSTLTLSETRFYRLCKPAQQAIWGRCPRGTTAFRPVAADATGQARYRNHRRRGITWLTKWISEIVE